MAEETYQEVVDQIKEEQVETNEIPSQREQQPSKLERSETIVEENEEIKQISD